MSTVKSLALLAKHLHISNFLIFSDILTREALRPGCLLLQKMHEHQQKFPNHNLIYRIYTKMGVVRGSQDQAKNYHYSCEVKLWVLKVKCMKCANQAAVEHVRPWTAVLSHIKHLCHPSSCPWQWPAAYVCEARTEHRLYNTCWYFPSKLLQ